MPDVAPDNSLVSATGGLLSAGAVVFAVAMLRAAARGDSAGPRLRTLAMGVGVLLGGLAGAASGLSVLLAPDRMIADVPMRAEIPLVAIFLVALSYLPGVLRPHQRRDALARLRVGLDTVGIFACLLFLPWLLVIRDERRGASITALVFGAGAAAVAMVAGVHAVRHRAALRWCGPAAALSLIGLTALSIGMDHPDEDNAEIACLAAAVAMVVSAAILWYATVRVPPDGGPLPPAGSEPAAGFPLFAAPLLGSALVAGYHVLNGRRLDAVSIALATAAITAVAARESTAAIALRRHADHLTDQGNRLRSLVFGSSDVAMVLDTDLAVRWQSPAAARQFGLSDQDVLGRPVTALAHPDQAEAVHAYLTMRLGRSDGSGAAGLTVRLRDGFGRWRETEWTTSGADPAEPGRTLVVHVRDVSGQGDLREALSQAAYLDHHTSLANRRGLQRAGDPVPDSGAMIVLELGGLTAISDLHGATMAEAVLVEAARLLRGRVDGADVPARIGDTRFAVLTRSGAVRAHLLASQLINLLTAPYRTAGTTTHLSAWAGLTDLAADAGGIDELIRRAELALRSVRSGPQGAVEWYEEEMESRLLRRSTLEQDLPGVVARGELDLTYQPIVELPERRPVGVEAVLSWRHPALGTVPAGEVLALAEDLGLLGELSRGLVNRACRELVAWRRRHDALWLSVGVLPRALADPVFQAGLDSALEANDLPESALVVEIAEEDLMRGPELDVAGELGKLRSRGIRTAVGRFGSGPTSLSRLRVLPIDLLKIDRDAFGPAGEDGIMDATVTLGRRLGMEVIAYGLRTDADVAAVQAAGCHLGQGELLGRPMPAERFEALLESSRAR